MTVDPAVLDRIFERLVRTLSAGGPDQLRAPFTIADIVQAFVPYRTYRHELGVDTLQDYEHAVLELLGGERPMLECDADTVAAIRKELSSPDPDTGLLRRIQQVQVRMGAIRMPVSADTIAQPIARIDLPPDQATSERASLRGMVSDAVAFGGAIDRGAFTPASSEPVPIESLAPTPTATPVVAAPLVVTMRSTPTDAPATAPANPSAATPATTPVTAHPPVPELPSIAEVAGLVQAPPASAPLHAVSGVTIASAQQVSRITPLAVPSVYGDPIDFRGVRHAPVDAGGVIFLFGMIARELGFHVEAMTSGFPRCEAKRQLAPGRWTRVRIDFELESRQFRDAGRNPSACDVVVCWRDTWPDRPASLEVLALDRLLPTLSARE